MAYIPSNASTFNQLIQQGLSVEEASTQSGVSDNASQYGFGTNSNAGAVIPGAGGVKGAAGLTQVEYPQNFRGYPSQGVQLAMNATEINEFVTQNPGFFIREIEPGVFVPGLNVSAEPPDPNSPGGNGGTNTAQDPAQRAAAEQIRATGAGASANPFSQDPAQRAAAAQVEAASAVPGANPFSQDPAQRAAAAQVEAAAAVPAANPFSQDPAQRAAAAQVEAAAAVPAANPFSLDPAQRAAAAAAGAGTSGPAPVGQNDAETARLARLEAAAAPIIPAANPFSLDPAQRAAAAAAETTAGRLLAQRQTTLEVQRKLADQNDWRVRLSLAPGSTYLYNAPSEAERGILNPLYATNGVIFPYTPKIDVGYRAKYNTAELTHSNYTSYFYQNSSVDNVRIAGTFTAQDTVEAQYLLAVIHFFRSATKMFYGQDAQRGAPPPLVFLTGLGQYQFNNHPCVIAGFEYSLPTDVDYIRAGSPNSNGTDLLKRRTSTQNNLATNPISGALIRLTQLFSGQGIQKGGIVMPPAPSSLSKNSPTYVPTKIEISLSLHPIVTRSQASQQFSLKQFANGDLVKKGFW